MWSDLIRSFANFKASTATKLKLKRHDTLTTKHEFVFCACLGTTHAFDLIFLGVQIRPEQN